MVRPRTCLAAVLFSTVTAAAAGQTSPPQGQTAAPPEADLTRLSLDELAALEVTSVSKKPESRFRTPAAVQVVTGDQVRRLGITSIPKALRLVPGVQVSQIDSSRWAIGIRGFASRLARSQLALMDGRSVYTPLFAGVYWETQDTLLEDVERVEVVRGPGGSLWGANAVNGIVNVITKTAQETPGGFLSAGLGNEERFGAARWGGRLGATGAYRVYAKYFQREAAFHETSTAFDDWHMGQGGFRTDWSRGSNLFTAQGDFYSGGAGVRTSFGAYQPPFTRTVIADSDLQGGNLLTRWRHDISARSGLQVQAYYDRTRRVEPNFRETRDTFDLDLQHRVRPADRHEVVWGVGYRVSRGATGGVETVLFAPATRTENLLSGFVQDEIQLRRERLTLVVGTKLEHNDYTGFEFQPSLRALWTPAARHAVWAAVSRGVRTPSRLEHDLSLTVSVAPGAPVFARVIGDREFESEKLYAYEAGYRIQLSDAVLFDLAAFFNRYPNLLSIEPRPPFAEAGRQIAPFVFQNLTRGRSSGAELTCDVRLSPRFSLHGGYAYLDLELRPRAGSRDTSQAASAGASARHGVFVVSTFTLAPSVDLDLHARWVDELPARRTPSYAELDARLAWRLSGGLELAAVGRNLLHDRHLEFTEGVEGFQVERSVQAQLAWRW